MRAPLGLRAFAPVGSLPTGYGLHSALLTPSPSAGRGPASPFQKVLPESLFKIVTFTSFSSGGPPAPQDSPLYLKPCFTHSLLCVSYQSIRSARFGDCWVSPCYPFLPPVPIRVTSNQTCAWHKINAVNHCQMNEWTREGMNEQLFIRNPPNAGRSGLILSPRTGLAPY